MEKGKKSTYYVEIKKVSYLEPKNITCKNYDTMEYAKCVGKEIQNITKEAYNTIISQIVLLPFHFSMANNASIVLEINPFLICKQKHVIRVLLILNLM